MARLFLGIDGGQSSTEAVIGELNGPVLGQGFSGPCNHVTGPEAITRFESAITSAVRQALAAAGIHSRPEFESACLGLSGGPDDKAEHVKRIVHASRYRITHDAEIALAGALDGGSGVIVIAGTGSMAFGRNEQGRSARAGGWGYLFGDEGGAWDIAKRATRAALACEEGWGPATSLLGTLLEQTGSVSANQMLHRFYTPDYPRSRVAALARSVDDCAADGDAVAAAILSDAGQALAEYASAVQKVLGTELFSYVGGVFSSAIVRAAYARTVGSCHPPAKSPAEGALHLARTS